MPEAVGAPPETQPTGAQPGTWVDPFRAYNFKLEIPDIHDAVGHFTQCSGIGVRVHPLAYREGGQNALVHQIPGPVQYASIELRYGLTQSRELWDWFMSVVEGKVDRRNVSVVILGSDGAGEGPGTMRWDLINAWPHEWRGAPLDAMGREIAIESVSLVFEGLVRS